MIFKRCATRFALAALIPAFAATIGCGEPEASAKLSGAVPVSGMITYKGKPLTRGTVDFEPESGREAHGEIQSDGRYELTTFKQGDGAVVGKHRVAVSGVNKKQLPVKYHDFSSSGIEIEVEAGKTDYPIELK